MRPKIKTEIKLQETPKMFSPKNIVRTGLFQKQDYFRIICNANKVLRRVIFKTGPFLNSTNFMVLGKGQQWISMM